MRDRRNRLQTVFDHFEPGGQASFASIAGGLIHNTYKVSRNEESYLLQKFNTHVFSKPEEVLSNIVKITAHLAGKSDYPYQVVSPFRVNDSEEYLYRDETGAFWRLFPYLMHSVTHESTSNPNLVYGAAHAYATFTSFMADFNLRNLYLTIPGFHDPVARWRQFEQAISGAKPHRKHLSGILINELRLNNNVFREFASLKLPVRIVHNDAKLSNVLFKENSEEPLAIIDLDTVMPGTVLCDFGDLVRTMSANVSEEHGEVPGIGIRKDLFQTIWAGYCSGLKDQITPYEKDNLFLGAAYIILEQVLRFLVDYLTGDRYYHVNYPDHNLDRALNQYALFKSLVSGKDNLYEGLVK